MARRMLKVLVNTDTVETRFEEFIQSRRISGCTEATIHSYRNLMHCVGMDMNQPIDEVDWNQIILSIRSRDVSPSTINTYLRTVKVFMKWLGITDNLPILKKVETHKELYTDDELKRMIEKPKRNCTYNEYRNWCIILLVLDTGMRAASVRNILVRDIDLDNNTVFLRHTKTHKIQILPFSNTTRNAIKSLLKVTESAIGNSLDNYLFPTVYGEQLTENGLWQAISDYNTSRGISKTSTHLLRHCFARSWITNGNDAFSLQQMLGHSDLTMTKHYCQLFSADLINKYKSPVEELSRKQIKK